MTLDTYIKFAFRKGLYKKSKWLYSTMTLPITNEKKDEFISLKDGKYSVNVENEYVEIEGISSDRPLITISDIITVTPEDIRYLDREVTTTVGLLLTNVILSLDPFEGAFKYMNNPFTVGDMEKVIAVYLRDDKVKVEQYIKFVNSCSYLMLMSRIVTVSATYKNSLPPKGLKEFKIKLAKDMTAKYGPDWNKDRVKIVEYETALKKFDDEWLKDDPTNGIFIAGKVKAQGRMKMYLSFGAETGFNVGDPVHVDTSLMDDIPQDSTKIASMFNASRYGSYGRGKETQKGGATAKDVLRATSAMNIVDGDCGSKVGKVWRVTKDNHSKLVGRYQLVNGKTKLIENTSELIGKTIIVRSPMFCHGKRNSLCSKCVGDILANYKSGISLIVTDISAIILGTSMKAMHGVTLKTVDFNYDDVIR